MFICKNKFHNINNITIYSVYKSLVVRFLCIGLFLCSFLKIKKITNIFIEIFEHPYYLSILIIETNIYKILKKNLFKSYMLITFIFALLLPIYRSFMSEIATDTTILIFSICQIFYCIDSVKIFILNNYDYKVNYSRNETIPLEEALLISLKVENNGIIGNMAAVIGFMAIFSIMNNDLEVLILQALGFYFYMFLPYKIDEFLDFKIFYIIFASLLFLIYIYGNFLFIAVSFIFLFLFYILLNIFEYY